MSSIDNNRPLGLIKGIGPARAELLASELQIHTLDNLLSHYPFRYEDRTIVSEIHNVSEEGLSYQLIGQINNLSIIDSGRVRRLVCRLTDSSGSIELVFFQMVDFMYKKLKYTANYRSARKPKPCQRLSG